MRSRLLHVVFLFVAPLVVTVVPKRAGADSCLDDCNMRYACDTGCCPDTSAELERCSAACDSRYPSSPPPPPGKCGAGLACTDSGWCTAACSQDADCPLTTTCSAGSCQAANTACTSALDCGPGQLCAFADPNVSVNTETGVCIVPCDATCADSRLTCDPYSTWGWLYPPGSAASIGSCALATSPADNGAACQR